MTTDRDSDPGAESDAGEAPAGDEGENRRGQPRHPIGVVESRTGVSSHTLRAWEKRYGAVRPERSEGGHRLYSDAEIRRLRLLHRLTEQGHRIGQLAELGTSELESLLKRDRDDRRSRDDGAGRDVPAELLDELYGAVRDFDGRRLDSTFRRAALQLDVHRLVNDVVAPMLRRIGEEWARGNLSPAEEHLASGVVVRTLGWVMNNFDAGPEAPGVVTATPSGQRHNLGAMLAAATAAAAGWRVTYLGGELPAEEIMRAARETGARAVALSLVYPPEDPETEEAIRALVERLPPETALLAGGGAATSYAPILEQRGAALLADFDDLRDVLEELAP